MEKASSAGTPNPCLNPALRLSPVEGGYLAFDAENDRLHQLNGTAALIAELCDGSRDIQEIRELAGPLLPDGSGDSIDGWIEAGVGAGLLVWRDGAEGAHRSMSASELMELSEHLRQSNRIEAALQCAKQATELTPEDSDTWHMVGRIAQLAGERQVARDAYERYLALQPEDASIRHVLKALRDEPPPPRASDACVVQTFKDFSADYDSKMRELLSYRGPEFVLEVVAAECGERAGLEILDLGCGTGLAGVVFKDLAATLTGVDLSPEMIGRARERRIYDALEVAEITNWLKRSGAEFDLILACDCLVYFGDLHEVAGLAANRLRAGGWFAFTVEQGDEYPLRLTDSGRYTHHAAHLREVAASAGFELRRLEEGFLRTEGGVPVIGLAALMTKLNAD